MNTPLISLKFITSSSCTNYALTTVCSLSNSSVFRRKFMPIVTMSSVFKRRLSYRCLSNTVTRFTKPSMTIFTMVSILWTEFMTIFAMSALSKTNYWRNTTKHIYFWCNRLKMVWIYTYCVSTQMIKTKSVRNLSIFEFIGKPMRTNLFFISNAKLSVSFCGASSPIPAIISFFYFIKKSFQQWGSFPHKTHIPYFRHEVSVL